VHAEEIIEPTEVVEPTEEVTEAVEPTEASDETTAPAETITVKFTDALYWGDVHVYYWDNGGEWPGKAMEQTDVNDYGQKVYSAEIPADVQGIIFNNNGKMQTVDIKDGIADGAWWYTVEQTDDQGHNFVKLVGEEPTEVVEPTEEVTEVVEPTTVPAEGSDYYLLGNMNGWTINEAYNLTKNAAADAEEYMIQVDLTTASQFKIVKLDGFKPVWYPTGSGNNYGQNGEITADGTYTIYFRPNYDGDESWFNSCIYASLDIPAPTTVVEPTEVTTEGGYYVVGNMTDWGIAEANKLTENEAAATKEYTFTMDLTTTSEFKVVYSEDGTTIKEWFPIGSENNYGQNGEIEADGTYDIYFRPNYDGTEDWFNGCIYVAIKETQPTEAPTEEPTTPTEIIWGDANGDGMVDITDATSIQRFLVDLATINEVASDVDGDGEVSIVDVNWIQRALAGMDLPENVHVTGYPFD
ncbi:starch-binding protein, partial [Ruminococcus sp.]|uniref:starch-binding protein n=1 Tax=Ruminococcus sp. TaxID=41978 RepID=UPI0038676662